MADTTNEEIEIVFIKQPAGVEDLLFGLGSVSQIREGDSTTIREINAYNIPYDATHSVGEVLEVLLLATNVNLEG